jgi:lipid-binding SYLF domain-containing protein
MIRTHVLAAVAAVAVLVTIGGCSTAPKTAADKASLEQRAADTIAEFKQVDPSIERTFFATAKGYAVFPTVGKGAIGVGGAGGQGVLFEGDKIVGYCSLGQATIGLQLGGQAYSEVIFFETDKALSDFKAGNMKFAAQVSAVAAAADASANADYSNGVAVFTLAAEGLMYEASVGGQKFNYQPK